MVSSQKKMNGILSSPSLPQQCKAKGWSEGGTGVMRTPKIQETGQLQTVFNFISEIVFLPQHKGE